jgi:hypothetical protein
VRFAFIAAEKAAFPVTVLCRILAVSRAGFYAAQARPVPGRARGDAQLAVEIAAIHGESVNGHPNVPNRGHRKFPTPGFTPWPRRGGRGRP